MIGVRPYYILVDDLIFNGFLYSGIFLTVMCKK